MNELSQEDDKDLHKKAKLTKKTSSNRFRKPLRIFMAILMLLFLCFSTAFLIYLSKSFYFFSNTDKFLCHKQGDLIPAQYKYVEDNTLEEGEQKITKEREPGIKRRCYSLFSPSYLVKEKDPVDGIISYRERKQDKATAPQNTAPIPTINHTDAYSGHCYEKRLPYKINVVYKEGYYDSDHTDLGMDGWEFICDGKVITHVAPMDGTRTITTARPTQEQMHSDVPRLKQPEIKPIESHICKRVNPHLVKCGK